jgi:hypothetical protein
MPREDTKRNLYFIWVSYFPFLFLFFKIYSTIRKKISDFKCKIGPKFNLHERLLLLGNIYIILQI